jgi:hypothetical protein
VSIHNKGRVCYLNPWEVTERKRGNKPNCRNHRHVSRAEAFEQSGNPAYGVVLTTLYSSASGKTVRCGYFVKVAGQIEFTLATYEPVLSLHEVRAKGLELEKKLGIPFIDRKVPLRMPS